MPTPVKWEGPQTMTRLVERARLLAAGDPRGFYCSPRYVFEGADDPTVCAAIDNLPDELQREEDLIHVGEFEGKPLVTIEIGGDT